MTPMNVDTDDRYEILDSEHGRGGFGKISKQRDTFLERLVAVKRQHFLADEESKERFTREAKTLARMSHPNVPAIYDVKVKNDEMLIYFEFVEGDNQYLNLKGIFPAGTTPKPGRVETPRTGEALESREDFNRRLGVQGHVNALLSNPAWVPNPREFNYGKLITLAIEIEVEINKQLNPSKLRQTVQRIAPKVITPEEDLPIIEEDVPPPTDEDNYRVAGVPF